MSRPFEAEEPQADLRAFAKAMRGMYVALVQEGFTPNEALGIIGRVLAANLGGGTK